MHQTAAAGAALGLSITACQAVLLSHCLCCYLPQMRADVFSGRYK